MASKGLDINYKLTELVQLMYIVSEDISFNVVQKLALQQVALKMDRIFNGVKDDIEILESTIRSLNIEHKASIKGLESRIRGLAVRED